MLIEAQGGETRAKYGNNLIKEYSKKLMEEVDKKYSERSLREMRQYYLYVEKWHPVGAKLTWSHHRILMSLNDDNKINYYMNQIIRLNLSKRQLQTIIKNKEYERLPESTKNKIIKQEKISIEDNIKNPIIINNKSNYEIINEKILQKLILENITNFMKM